MSGRPYGECLSARSTEEPAPYRPKNISEAIEMLDEFIDSQLPNAMEIEFIPICFDVASDQNRIVIGGQHGNLGIFDLNSKKITKDIELISKSITSVLLALKDTMVIAAAENSSVYFLEFPSFYLLQSLTFPGQNLSIAMANSASALYISDSTNKIYIQTLPDFESISIDCKYPVRCFDISNEASMLVLGYESGEVQLFHNETQSFLQSVNEGRLEIDMLRFSGDVRLVAAAFVDFSVKVWNIDPHMTEKNCFVFHTGKIRGMEFASGNRYLITGSADKKIVMFDMKINSTPYIFELYDAEILWFRISPNGDKLYFSQDLNKFMIWQIPTMSKNVRYQRHEKIVNKVMFIPNTSNLLSLGDDGLAVIWDYQGDLIQDLIQLEGSLITGIVSSTSRYAFLSSSRPSLIRLNLSSCKYYDYDINSAAISMSFSSDENLLAIGDALFRIVIFDSVIMERKYIIKGHTDTVTDIYFLECDSLVLTSSRDTKLIKWDNATSDRLSTFDGHSAAVLCMVVSPDEELAVSGSDDSEVIIWSVKQEVMMHKIKQEASPIGTVSLYLSKDKSYIIAAQGTMVNYWETKSLSIIFQKNTRFSATCMALSRDEGILVLAEGKTIFLEENALHSEKLKIVGKSYGSPHKFLHYIKDLRTKSYKIKHLDIYNHWMFTPYRLGIAHILCYINKEIGLASTLLESQNKSSFCSTANNENPLSISVKLDHIPCIIVCLKYLKSEFLNNNLRAYISLANCLTNITLLDIPAIPKLYDTLFQQCKSLHLPNFCVKERVLELPTLCHSENFTVNVPDLLPEGCACSHGESIKFYYSLVPLELELGTNGSIKFLQSLLTTRYTEIFRSRLLKVLLTDKWDRIKYAIYVQGLMYISYLFLLSVYCILDQGDRVLLVILFSIHVLMASYEILQIFTDFYDYWSDWWNILDQLRCITFTIYAYMEWQSSYDPTLFLTVMIFSWTRGISYFRIFEGTRYMIRLLSEVISDMQVFLILLSYSTLAFSFVLMLNNGDQPFSEYLKIAYQLNLSVFYDNYSGVSGWTIFFFATLINPLIMLNMLISIMANTYKLVKQGNDIANFQELTQMILEIEKIMFWKRGIVKQQFLQQCLSNISLEINETDKSVTRLKGMRDQILKIEKNIHIINSSIHTESLLEVKQRLLIALENEAKYKQIIEKNQAALKSANAVLMKVATKLKLSVNS